MELRSISLDQRTTALLTFLLNMQCRLEWIYGTSNVHSGEFVFYLVSPQVATYLGNLNSLGFLASYEVARNSHYFQSTIVVCTQLFFGHSSPHFNKKSNT